MAVDRLGHYRLLEHIGSGGMGAVYRAHDERLDRDVAIKVLHSGSNGGQSAGGRLLEEARSASHLNHPHICTIYEVGEENGIAFIVMEYVAGRPMSEIIPPGGLSSEQVIHYAIQIADALDHAHRLRIVHGDVKPANVMVTAEGNAKVLDFGLARRLRREEIEETTASQTDLAGAGLLAGTLPYMAPEQLRAQPPDSRSDIWSFGVLLYEMTSGHRPFPTRSGFELSSAILRDAPPPLPGHISPGLEPAIRKCLAKDPGLRYRHAGEVRSALETLQSTATVISKVSTTPAMMGRRNLLLAGIGGAAALLVILFALNVGGWRQRLAHRTAASEVHSLAVLPLANLSGDPSQDFFADGMTAELTDELSKIEQLRVVSRTSVMDYKGTHKPLPQIASELRVNALLEGSVARSGNHVRIATSLYDGAADRLLWSETFERNLNEVLALEEEVAHAIAVKIRLKLSSQGRRHDDTDPEAFDLYLKGRYALDQGSEEQLRLALVYFRKGIDKDPRYAPLYAGLADAYALLPFYTDTRPTEAFPKSKEAAAKALQLDPTLAAAHASMAYVINYYDWNRAGAEEEFQQALRLNPNDAATHHAYSRFLASLGRLDEARAELDRARELDPLSLVIQSNVGMIAYFARRYDDALQELQQVLELDPKFSVPYWGIGMCYEQQKRYPEAVAKFQKGIELSGRGANGIASLAHAYGLAGQDREAQKILAELKNRSKTEYVSSYQFALIYLGLGQNDRAMLALQDAYRERSTLLGYLKMDPRFDPLRSDPRFRELLSLVHLPN
jgi:eukaryotic-like serine/threonine-protein kinase